MFSLAVLLQAACGASTIQGSPNLIAGADRYLVVWAEGHNGTTSAIKGTFLTFDGAPATPCCLTLADNRDAPSSLVGGWNGSTFLVAWQETFSGDIMALRVGSDGASLDGGNPIALATGPQIQAQPSVASSGSEFFVTWADAGANRSSSVLRAARVTSDGAVRVVPDPLVPPQAMPTHQGGAQLAFDGTNYLIVWDDFAAGNMLPFAGVLRTDGTMAEPPVALTAPSPAAAVAGFSWNAETGGVLLQDSSSSGAGLALVRVQRTGAPLDQSPVPLALLNGSPDDVAIAATPTGHLVVAWENGRLLARKVDGLGMRTDAVLATPGRAVPGNDLRLGAHVEVVVALFATTQSESEGTWSQSLSAARIDGRTLLATPTTASFQDAAGCSLRPRSAPHDVAPWMALIALRLLLQARRPDTRERTARGDRCRS